MKITDFLKLILDRELKVWHHINMTETVQVLLIAVITVLTIILTIIGIQVVYILKEFRRMVENVNKILADAGKVSEGMSSSFAEITGVASGIRTVLGIFNLFARKGKKKEPENE